MTSITGSTTSLSDAYRTPKEWPSRNGSYFGSLYTASKQDLSHDHADIQDTSDVATPTVEHPQTRLASLQNQVVVPQQDYFANGVGTTSKDSVPVTAADESVFGRRSVSFARPGASADLYSQPLTNGAAADAPPISRSSTIAAKIKSLALPLNTQGHGRSQSNMSGTDANGTEATDFIGMDGPATTGSFEPISTSSSIPRRGSTGGTKTAPTTPKQHSFRNILGSSRQPHTEDRPGPVRRSTMTDAEEEQAGVSEDEGRARAQRSSRTQEWRRRHSAWMPGSRTQADNAGDENQDHSASRPNAFRRITAGFTAGASSPAPDGTSPSPFRYTRTETGAQKWRQIKAAVKMMGQKKKDESNRIDHLKSAELMAELLAGSPAALILASSFTRDEREKKKIPVLLEQLKIRITDSYRREDSAGDRMVVFRIELEYGSGLMRMKWVIQRSLRDFVNLHVKFKLQNGKMKYKQQVGNDGLTRAKLPRFPKSAFPWLRGVRGLVEEDDEEEPDDVGADPETARTPSGRPAKSKSRQASMGQIRRLSSAFGSEQNAAAGTSADAAALAASNRDAYAERQRKRLERYLRELIRFVIFRTGSNRLCRFLELSALGMKLAAEGGYHGKEGHLTIQSGKGVDFRKALTPTLFIQRHRPMWFLVRHSYIVAVDSPEDMNIYDVFLVDSDFTVQARRPRLRDQKKAADFAKTAKQTAAHPQHHILRVNNAERKIRLVARNERQLIQFEESLRFMQKNTQWSQQHRFGSFAPIRQNVYAQWLVDARDYMWNVSRAINMAQDVIYIHDWWLSPELYLRRPAAISHKWRLDRLLKQKAEEGVKIFVIMYRNINSAIPIDSEYSKFSLLDLHENIHVQRSPNQVRQNVFFWAHHEKICVIDHTVAFCGGVDLCFGRWDTPQHAVVDDKATGFESGQNGPKDADHCQLWPGKDYSNPRVLDFFKLDDPYGEMYDRSKVPRMPWHDIGMQIVGQPARDLTRHFVQRWNYILRQRKPTRPTPFLLPPPDFNDADLEAMHLDGTCNIQMLRSACDWSIGTPGKVEHSIMNAYVKLIEMSEHFVYIENQFFISSCKMDGNEITNTIGDALVERIERAHKKGEIWRCIIVIPLMPGFANTVDSQDGSSVRLIMQCQYRSINRGSTSIFERLRTQGIEPEDYIQFFSLRSWGKIGPSKALVTEQLYIHAKCMVVDDRWAIIGSANINERSMLGERDSEVAAVVWDNDMVDSTMAEEPFKVGRFPHTLRMRLMREHLGVDVDGIMEEERREREEMLDDEDDESVAPISPVATSKMERKLTDTRHKEQDSLVMRSHPIHTFNHDADEDQANNPHIHTNKRKTRDSRVTDNTKHKQDVEGHGFDNMAAFEDHPDIFKGRDSMVTGNREYLVNNLAPEKARRADTRKGNEDKTNGRSQDRHVGHSRVNTLPPWNLPRMDTREMGLTMVSQLPPLPDLDDTDIGGPPLVKPISSAAAETLNPVLANFISAMKRPIVNDDCMKDPLNEAFYRDTWQAVAENNTKLYRQVFRCQPDSQVTNWKEYHEYNQYAERFAAAQGTAQNESEKAAQETQGQTGPPGTGMMDTNVAVHAAKEKLTAHTDSLSPPGQQHHGLIHKISDRLLGRKSSTKSKASTRFESRPNTRGATPTSEPKPPMLDGVAASNDNALNEKPEAPTANGAHVDFGALPTREETVTSSDSRTIEERGTTPNGDLTSNLGSVKKQPTQQQRKRAGTKSSMMRASDPILSKGEAEDLVHLVQGSLVQFPLDWLYKRREVVNGCIVSIRWHPWRSTIDDSVTFGS